MRKATYKATSQVIGSVLFLCALAASGAQADELLQPAVAAKHGPIGPFPDAAVIIHDAKNSAYAATIIAHHQDKTQRFTLALANWNAVSFKSLHAGQADSDPDVELLIVASYMTGMGPQGAQAFDYPVIIDWKTDKFEVIANFKSLTGKPSLSTEEAAKSIGFTFARTPDPAAPATIDPDKR